MLKRRFITLVPVLAVLAAVLGVGTSSASAAEGACANNVLCGRNSTATNAERLRDDFVEPPEGVSGGSFGASLLAVNTAGALRLTSGAAFNENPKGDAFFGLKLHSNPPTVATGTVCKEGLGEAEGWVLFADIQNATNNAGEPSPVYDDTSPGDNGPWPIGIRSDHCSARAGVVTIEHVALFLPKLAGGVTVTGVLTGNWVQPTIGAEEGCKGGRGGVELKEKQTVTLNGTSGQEIKINNGVAGKLAFICFVSSNNELFPTTPPTWAPFTGGIWKD